jgi:hypothetical protein
MARYTSSHELALTEEVVPLDGPDLGGPHEPDDVRPVETATAGLGLGVIEPTAIEREERAIRHPRSEVKSA